MARTTSEGLSDFIEMPQPGAGQIEKQIDNAHFHILFIFPSSFLHIYLLILKVEDHFLRMRQPVTPPLAANLQRYRTFRNDLNLSHVSFLS